MIRASKRLHPNPIKRQRIIRPKVVPQLCNPHEPFRVLFHKLLVGDSKPEHFLRDSFSAQEGGKENVACDAGFGRDSCFEHALSAEEEFGRELEFGDGQDGANDLLCVDIVVDGCFGLVLQDLGRLSEPGREVLDVGGCSP